MHKVAGLAALGTLALLAAPAASETITIACGSGPGVAICKEATDAWAERSGHKVEFIAAPNSPTEQLALYQQFLAAGSGDIDVFQIDVIWPSLLADHLVDLGQHFSPEEVGRHLDAVVENNTVDGRLVAIPWFTETALLYYRKDLLEAAGKAPPTTWQEVAAMAQELQDAARAEGNGSMWGLVYQAKAYEGLTCVALEWVDSFGGGTILNSDGKITINNPQAAAAIDWAATTVGTIAPDGVLNYGEEEARGVFQSGNAVFMRNWPYVWPLAQGDGSPVQEKVGVVVLPSGGDGGKTSGCLGGWQLAVSKYSPQAEIAIDLVRYLASADEQKRRAIRGAYVPTIEALYSDAEIAAALPVFESLQQALPHAVARPSRLTGSKYNQVSSEFYNAVHEVLSGRSDAAIALEGLEGKLDRMSRGGRW